MYTAIRPLLVALCLGISAPIASAETLADLITRYEAFDRAGSPEEIAKAAGEEPKRWTDVSPDFVAARAEQASEMLAALNALEDTSAGPETAILRHLLTAQVNAHTYDTARIPFVGDWGFFAQPPFTAMRTRANSRERAQAWIARLNDLPRYFDDHITNMTRGIDTDWTQNTDPLETSIAQIKAQIVDDPTESTLFLPFLSLDSSSLSEDEIAALKTQGETAVETAITAYE
ncbi:MAG: DUF885 family protein, partial [Pseudomonadota bacterium]